MSEYARSRRRLAHTRAEALPVLPLRLYQLESLSLLLNANQWTHAPLVRISGFFRVGNKQKVLEINSPGFHSRNINKIHLSRLRYALNELILKSFVLESMTRDLENSLE